METEQIELRNLNIFIKKCSRCSHEWMAKIENPVLCPKCKSPNWNKERKGTLLNSDETQQAENWKLKTIGSIDEKEIKKAFGKFLVEKGTITIQEYEDAVKQLYSEN